MTMLRNQLRWRP